MAIGSHVIPRFYLEQFAAKRKAGKPGFVWVYEKGKAPRPSSTKAQGYENGYFAFVRSDGTRDESFEVQLAELEGRCNDELFCARSSLFDLRLLIHRTTLAFYMGLLFARSTSRRRFFAGNWTKMQEPFSQLEFNDEYVRDTAAHFTERSGVEFTLEDIREMIRRQAVSFVEEKNTGNTFIRDLLFHAETLKAELVPRVWQVWEAPPGSEFVTSDNPVVTFVRQKEDLWHPGHGTRIPGVVVAMPLAATACLTIGFADKPDFKTVDFDIVQRMNEIAISSCDRFVYSKTKSQEVAEMVDSFGGWSKPGETAFIGEALGPEKIEEYLRQKMGIKRQATGAIRGKDQRKT